MRLGKHLGSDMPQLEMAVFAALAAGSATDPAVDTFICGVTDPALLFGSLTSNELSRSTLPIDRLIVRQASIISQGSSNTTGVAAHYADLRLNVYRLGVLQGCIAYLSLTTNTTLGTAITSSNQYTRVAVTPASMTGIVAGMTLAIDSGGSLEYVRVLSTTSTTFTGIFTKTHTTSATVVSVLVPQYMIPLVPAYASSTTGSSIGATGSQSCTPASIYGIRVGDWLLCDTVASTVQETVQVTAITATTFTATYANTHGSNFPILTSQAPAGNPLPTIKRVPFELRENDVLTFNRVSNDATGLATPALYVQIDWIPSR